MCGERAKHILLSLFVASAAVVLPVSASAAVFERPLSVGSSGDDVVVLQVFLKSLGLFNYPTATGFFGAVTHAAVRAFQQTNNLDPVGRVGPLTTALLNTIFLGGGAGTTTAQSSSSGLTLEVENVSADSVELSWTEVAGADDYAIYRKETDESFSLVERVEDTAYTDMDVEHSNNLTYYVETEVNGSTIRSADIEVEKTRRSNGRGNRPPSDIALSDASINEGASIGTEIGTLSATDPDGSETATYALLDDAGGLFAIDGDSLEVAGALDYESDASHIIEVQVTDRGDNTFTKEFTVAVTDLNAIVSTFTATSTSNTDLSTYTFSSQPIGTASADRYVLVAVQGRGTADYTYTGVTVGGITATEVGQAVNSGSAVGFFIAPVPTGTTADVVVTTSASIARASIGLYALTGVGGTLAVDSASDLTGSNPMSGIIDVPAEGAAFAAAYNGSGASPTTSTWTGLTERYDFQGESNHDHTGAASDFASAQTGLTVSVQNSGIVSNGVFYVVSLR